MLPNLLLHFRKDWWQAEGITPWYCRKEKEVESMDNQTVSLTASNIRYLLAVEKLTGEGRVRCVDVARQLGVARPSALRALETLAAMGLFQKSPEGTWSLTDAGAALAARYREYYNTVGGLLARLLPPETDQPTLILSVLSEVPLQNMDEVCRRIRRETEERRA